MTEDKNGVKNGEANTEMAPQEDGTKVPLTDNECPEAKFTTNDPPNGDARIDMGTVPTFTGLTKEELLKYSDDPFWVRLRWVLFIIFWLGWAAMLAVAIVIIVQAPRCAPQEKLEWVQESAMLQYDVNNGVDADGSNDVNSEDVVAMAQSLGMTSVYLEGLISLTDFEKISEDYNEADMKKILENAMSNNIQVVTDFIPSRLSKDHIWMKNDSYSNFFVPGSNELNFTNEDLITTLTAILRDSWVMKGVKGFLMANADTLALQSARDSINAALDDVDGVVVSNVTDMSTELETGGFNAAMFKDFLTDHVNDWTYYKYNPKVAESSLSPEVVRLVTVSLFLVPGTPIVSGLDETYFSSTKDEIKSLSNLRMKDSVQIGTFSFANTTDEGVVAFARVLKGTPGYAVAVNFDGNRNATVDFTTISGVDSTGDVSLQVGSFQTEEEKATKGRQDLSNVHLEPFEGKVLQFVPNL